MSGTTGAPASQTLSRGIRILEVLADAADVVLGDTLRHYAKSIVNPAGGRTRGIASCHHATNASYSPSIRV